MSVYVDQVSGHAQTKKQKERDEEAVHYFLFTSRKEFWDSSSPEFVLKAVSMRPGSEEGARADRDCAFRLCGSPL